MRLAEAMATAKELAGTDTAVTGEVVDNGWTVDDLVRGSTGHPLLVLQHRALNGRPSAVRRLHRAQRGRPLHVPVVSVPEGWAPRTDRPSVVIAAVQDAVEAPALLRVAFEAARARGASLVVMHAWWLASGYDVVVVDGAFRAQWTDQSRRDIAPVLAPLGSEFPDVPVEVDVRHAPPVEAVLDAAENLRPHRPRTSPPLATAGQPPGPGGPGGSRSRDHPRHDHPRTRQRARNRDEACPAAAEQWSRARPSGRRNKVRASPFQYAAGAVGAAVAVS